MISRIASSLLGVLVLTILFVGTGAVFWSDFRVHYDVNPIGNFNRMPKTELEAKRVGWSDINFACYNNGDYLGFRYVMPGDNSLVLIYDVMGVIAGLQMLLPHDEVLIPNNTFRYAEVPMFNNATFDNKQYFVLTAYFVNPEIICTTGRNETDLINVGTGDGIWIQDGPTPTQFLTIPDRRADAIDSGWSNNNCFPGMGTHSWYRMEDYEATNCDVQVPVFGMWNRALELHGFGFSAPGTVLNPHFENPPTLAVSLIAGDIAPQCLLDSSDLIGSTTMHVYFVDNPWLIICN